jgi:hypothetical protein
MTRDELTTGDIVQLHNGMVLLVCPNLNSDGEKLGLNSMHTRGCLEYLSKYTSDLKCISNSDHDIIAVYKSSQLDKWCTWYLLKTFVFNENPNTLNKDKIYGFEWDWQCERREMTVKEIEDILGFKIIIKEDTKK